MIDDPVAAEPFHGGEIAVQVRAGERDRARRHEGVISREIVPGARPFLARQRLLGVTVAGDDKQLWTSIWLGRPGFARSPDGRQLAIDKTLLRTSPDDPAASRLAPGRHIGLLALEFESRRRLRVNGAIDTISAEAIVVAVRESAPNCAKYIRRRRAFDVPSRAGDRRALRPVERGREIDRVRRRMIEETDTAFVGSVHPVRGVDASHRGGEPGFIRVIDAATLRLPDYTGNSLFMTLGNFAADPRASLTVLDFEAARVLAMSGSARIEFNADHAGHTTGGTHRYWEFAVREWVEFDLPRVIRWERLDPSPFNPPAHAS